jgi:hypothetical protein
MLALFSAPCHHIEKWAGVPQKKTFGKAETTGFQREFSDKRLKSLIAFFSDPENIIQNPLICSTRSGGLGDISYQFDENGIGEVVLQLPDLDEIGLIEVLKMVAGNIESRVSSLAGTEPSEQFMNELKMLATEEGHELDVESFVTSDDSSIEGDQGDPESVLFEETHIVDFWNEVKGRALLAEELDIKEDEFLGFEKYSLIQFLLPVALVDGQHRLRGSMLSLEKVIESDVSRNYIAEQTVLGKKEVEVYDALYSQHARILPISLMLDDSPEEQVFQFVIINQKATPLQKPLLSTIISTTLAAEELEKVQARLKDAGMELTDAQAVTWAARAPESPFNNLVERGVANTGKDLLQWSVAGSLVSISRDLKGTDLWGFQSDFAKRWRETLLLDSAILSDYETKGFESKYEYWRSLNGPWKTFFEIFWSEIQKRFSTDDHEGKSFWGKPRSSNLFNKISLTILISDFFKYLFTTRAEMNDFSELPALIDKWLYDVNTGYFNRDWQLRSVKKDSTGIRKQWADLWIKYRENPAQLPQLRAYGLSKVD